MLDELKKGRKLKQELSDAILRAMRDDPEIQQALLDATQEIFNELRNRN
jgi:hypothetical protein